MNSIRILLVIDNTPAQHDLLRLGAELSWLMQANIGLLHIIDPGEMSLAAPDYDARLERLQRQGYGFLYRLAKRLPDSSGKTYLRISQRPDRMITAVANLFEADYVVMSDVPAWLGPHRRLPEFIEQIAQISTVPIITCSHKELGTALVQPLCCN